MQDLNDLYYFVQVVDHQGFAPAGRALGIPKSTLSRRIARLEERLGVRLLQRSTRHFSVTDVGERYLEHCRAMLVEADAARDAIARIRAEPAGVVRMSCPVALLHASIGAMLADFLARHPKVALQVDATNRRVDVIGEGVDLALRARTPPLEDSELVLRVLAKRSWLLVASPRLVGDEPPTLAALPALPSVTMGPPQRAYVWTLAGPDGVRQVPHTPRLVTDDMATLLAAVCHGVGVAALPLMVARAALARGELVEVAPGWAPAAGIVHAVFPSRRGLLPSVRSLLDFLAARFAALDREGAAAP